MSKKKNDLAIIISRIENAKSWRDSNYRDNWRACLDLYKSKPAPRPEGRSNVFVPYTFMLCETVKGRISESLFNTRPYITVLPTRPEEADKAIAAQALLDWQMNERMEIERVCTEDILSDLIELGTTVTYTGWHVKTRKQKRKEVIEQPLAIADGSNEFYLDEQGQPIVMPGFDIQEEDVVVYDDPIVQKVDLFDFFVDRAATDINDARFCGHTEYLTREQIENHINNNDWKVDFEKISTMDDDGLNGQNTRLETSSKAAGEDNTDFDPPAEGTKYQVDHYWEDNRHVVIVGKTLLALDEENPFWHGMKPYDKCCYIPLTGEFYGIGVPDIVKGLQEELNTSRNQRTEYVSMALRRMWKLRKGCGLTAKDLIWRQNGIIQVENMDDVQEILVQQLSSTAFADEEILKQDMKDATGVHDIILGLAPSNETATTTMTKDNNASIRFKAVVRAVTEDLLVPIAEKTMVNNQQFLDEEVMVRVYGDTSKGASELMGISPTDLLANFDFRYVGTSVEPMANKEMKKQRMEALFDRLSGHPLMQNDPDAQIGLMRQLLVAEEIENIDELLPKVPEPMPQQPPAPGAPGEEMPIDPAMLANMAQMI